MMLVRFLRCSDTCFCESYTRNRRVINTAKCAAVKICLYPANIWKADCSHNDHVERLRLPSASVTPVLGFNLSLASEECLHITVR